MRLVYKMQEMKRIYKLKDFVRDLGSDVMRRHFFMTCREFLEDEVQHDSEGPELQKALLDMWPTDTVLDVSAEWWVQLADEFSTYGSLRNLLDFWVGKTK